MFNIIIAAILIHFVCREQKKMKLTEGMKQMRKLVKLHVLCLLKLGLRRPLLLGWNHSLNAMSCNKCDVGLSYDDAFSESAIL